MNAARLPGTPRQQSLQRAIVQAFAEDPAIITIGVFGSLARPECDEWSDIDLDVTGAPTTCTMRLHRFNTLPSI